MIKKISVRELTLGMYVHDINCGRLDHPFALNQFSIDDAALLGQLRSSGIAEVLIDTDLGVIVRSPENDAVEVVAGLDESSFAPFALASDDIAKSSSIERFNRVKKLCANATQLMQSMMGDVRMGQQLKIEQCEPVVDNILDAMFSFPSAMLPLVQVKNRDEYTFQHSVSVAALAVAFGRVLELPRDELKELALGGLLHDVGKARVPVGILNKPSKLDDAEFSVMKKHVLSTTELLRSAKGVSEIAFNAASQHHERFDGTGYPHGLKGGEISLHGQMLAIVDVYDAITSLRVYHKGMPPTDALRKLVEWGDTHFNPRLVQAFIKGVGIYPAGSLVRMESDMLGIVREVKPERLLQPVVQLIFDCTTSSPITPETVDLAASHDKIKSHESFEKWGIDQARWATAHI